MSTHYATCAPIAVLGGFLVVVSQAFAPATVGWVAAGVAIGVIVIAVLAQLNGARGRVQRTLDGAIVADAGLLTAFALESSGISVVWLTFAFALGVVALAFAVLSLHAVSNWQAQHQLAALRWLPNMEMGARRTAVPGCVTDRHAVREPGETIPLSPGSHHYCVDGHANAPTLVGVGELQVLR